jgi:hypothetical protein
VIQRHGPWPFITRAKVGDFFISARAHRKNLLARAPGLSWLWQPTRLGWWIAWSFAIGSSCFMAGAILANQAIPPAAVQINLTFAIGAVFFTAAAWAQFLEAINAPPSAELYDEPPQHTHPFRFWGWRPRMVGYWASLVQLIGTLSFNVMTLDAFIPGLNSHGQDLATWTPNIIGSVCFLIASILALIEVCHRWFCLRLGDMGWWIAALNLLGSIAFQFSALYAYIPPAGVKSISLWLNDFWTAIGGACFLVASLMLLPETAPKDEYSKN